MAKNRVIPFGYCMRNGEITVDFKESKVVIRIFEGYLNGSSLLQIANGEEIVIEADAKNSDVKGEPCEINWIELAKKTSNADSRKAIDKYFSNYEIDGSKIGSFYLNADCKQESNNTLLTALGNQFVADLLSGNDDMMSEISQYLNKDYADLETSDYLSAMFNAYFELMSSVTLTFDPKKHKDMDFTNLDTAHKEFNMGITQTITRITIHRDIIAFMHSKALCKANP